LISYLDTSFLVSLYTSDANSAAAAAYIHRADLPFPLTPFGEVELTNAIELRIFRREIIAAQAKTALEKLASHIADGVFHVVPVPVAMYDVARELSRNHTAALGARTLDILHVASALVLETKSFYTFDRRQAQLARAAGLATPVRIR
jgi:predicted nucleic acid-binding protein